MIAGLISIFAGIILLSTSRTQFVPLRLFIRWSIAGIPLLALGYSMYVILCIGLSLDALRRPGPSMRMMGALARQRARPWLVAVSLILFLVSLLVAGVMLWIVQDARQQTFWEVYQDSIFIITAFDLLISLLTAAAIVLLGQAIVSYEVFTGKTLPRQGLWRHWRRVVALAVGYGIIVGGSLAINLRPLYSLLLTTFLMTLFAALFSWRSFVEREQYIDNLRPFVASQRLYDQLLTPSVPADVDITTPFQVLCEQVLDAQLAYLAPLGPLAPLVGSPLTYGQDNKDLPPFTNLINTKPIDSHQTMAIPIDPDQYGGAVWAIPLWSERGLIGLFLLGKKNGEGLYSQEEIEIARISGERLIDTQASAEMARRLMTLQRQRLAQTQVIDQHTRRTLHDDILPTLQAAVIALSSSHIYDPQVAETLNMLTSAHRQISDLLHAMPTTTAPEVARLGLIEALQHTVEADFGHAFDAIEWQVEPKATIQMAEIPSLTAEVIFYAAREAVRNAAKYGRATDRPFHLCVQITWQEGLAICIEDSGGLMSVSLNQGNGQGLAIHSTMMAVVGGILATDSVPGQYTRVTLTLPQENWL